MSEQKALKDAGLSIGSFAEQLLQQTQEDIKEGKTPPIMSPESAGFGMKAPDDVPDVQNVNVDNSYVDQILNEGFNVPVKNTSLPRKKPSPKSSTRKPDDILKEFMQVVEKGKALIDEMTCVGMIGTNQGGAKAEDPFREKKKKRSKKDAMKEILVKRGKYK